MSRRCSSLRNAYLASYFCYGHGASPYDAGHWDCIQSEESVYGRKDKSDDGGDRRAGHCPACEFFLQRSDTLRQPSSQITRGECFPRNSQRPGHAYCNAASLWIVWHGTLLMSHTIPRLAPEIPLPPYAYVRGQYPHPTRDRAGHSFGNAPKFRAQPAPDRWEACRPYLYGIDLFNHGYFWEAHEVWEGLWHASGRKGRTADFLKGLIALAAARLKLREGAERGVRQHAARHRRSSTK